MLYPDYYYMKKGIPWQVLGWLALALLFYLIFGDFSPVEQFGWAP